MPRVLVFDVNETLLDLAVLDPHFEGLFGQATVRHEWFARVLQQAMVVTIAGGYRDFVAVGRSALDAVAARHGVPVADEARFGLADAMQSLPAHADVQPALARLHGAGLRLAALTNSPQRAAEAQLDAAGLAGFFERIMSVERVGLFKPAAAVYEMAAVTLAVEPAAMTMVAAHDWDIAGAMAVGCVGAFVARSGATYASLYPPPDLVGSDLGEVADLLLA